jgi:hypothetical protein
MRRSLPIAASAAVELPLVGPPVPATVVAATNLATYLEVHDDDRTIVCLAAASAVRVPCAAVLAPNLFPPQLPPGTIGTVGNGSIHLSGVEFRVNRWWRPPRPHGLGAVSPAQVSSAVRWLTGRVADPLDGPGRTAVAELVLALSAAASALPRPTTATAPPRPTTDPALPRPPAATDLIDDAVRRLLGRGPGLTPTGDDVLAGALVSLTALGSPAAAPLARSVLTAAPDATTTVSVALLRHATRGVCIPQLADLLAALSPSDQTTLPRAAGALLAVGHCSGAGLLHGALVGLAIAHTRIAQQVLAAA